MAEFANDGATMRAPLSRTLIALLGMCLLIGGQFAWSGVMSSAADGGSGPNPSATQTAASPPPSDERRIAAIQSKIENAQRELAVAQAASEQTLPRGITTEELQERQDLLRWLLSWYEQQLSGVEALANLQRSRAQLEGQMQSWRGFPVQPPASLELLDQLWQESFSKHRELLAAEAKLRALESLTGEARKSLKESEAALRQADERLEQAHDPDVKARDQWRREQAELRHRVDQAKVLGGEAQFEVFTGTVEYVRQEQEFLRRKVRQVSEKVSFSRADLDRKLAQVAAQRDAIVKDLASADRDKYSAREGLARIQKQIDEARRLSGAAGQSDAARTAALAALDNVFQARKVQADTASTRSALLQLVILLLDREYAIWEQRYALQSSRDDNRIAEAIGEIGAMQERVATWKSTIFADLDSDVALLTAQQKRLAEWRPEYGDIALGSDVLSAYQERIALRHSTLDRFEHAEALLLGWVTELQERRKGLSGLDRAASLAGAVGGFAARLWNTELFTVADTIVVDGQEVSGKRSVTVGKVGLIVLVVTIGFWVIRHLSGLLKRIAIARSRGDVIHGMLTQRVSYLVLLVLLVITALTMVHIPLTAFAFLGGTVAIALGFGAQNLANNFISGLILMIERPIKIGDTVEIEGVRGKVITIGARSCLIRRADGIEILVPNSTLLQESVTNVTHTDRRMRVSMSVGVNYGSPTRETERLILGAVEGQPGVLQDPRPLVLFQEFGDNALVFETNFWVEVTDQGDYRTVVSEVRHRIDELFRQAGIGLAFPQRDVHLDTSGPLRVEIARPDDAAMPRSGPAKPQGERAAKSQ